MAKIIYCWEHGADLGHITPWSRLIPALQELGHEVVCILKDCTHANRLLSPLGVRWFSAPMSSPSGRGSTPLNHAQMLQGLGYDEPEQLIGLIKSWQNLFNEIRPDGIILDSAPTAKLASDILKIPSIGFNTGFHSPPISEPLPSFRPWIKTPASTLKSLEKETLITINKSLRTCDGEGMHQFSDLYNQKTLFHTWPEINPFGEYCVDAHLGPIEQDVGGSEPCWPKITGRRVFIYLKGAHERSEELVCQVLDEGFIVSAYLPGFKKKSLEQYSSTGRIFISNQPVNLNKIDSDVDFVISHGSCGMIARFAGRGTRMLLVPQHLEHFLTCLASEKSRLPVVTISNNDVSVNQYLSKLMLKPRSGIIRSQVEEMQFVQSILHCLF